MRDTAAPVLLVQDYHFGLLPELVKKQRPDARVAIFWHIPWPNSESFAICPWQREMLIGLLGADVIGFHIQAHCTNFLQTVDRTLESRIDWALRCQPRGIKAIPISVTPDAPPWGTSNIPPIWNEEHRCGSLGSMHYSWAGGIRTTKGILERFPPLSAQLKNDRLTKASLLIQIGAPAVHTLSATMTCRRCRSRSRTHQLALFDQQLETDCFL